MEKEILGIKFDPTRKANRQQEGRMSNTEDVEMALLRLLVMIKDYSDFPSTGNLKVLRNAMHNLEKALCEWQI